MAQKPPVILLVYANDNAQQGVFLENLNKEVRGIEKALQGAERDGICELVKCPSATIADVVDKFQDPRYNSRIAIFHYAGHASGDALLLEAMDGGHSIAHKEGLIDILSQQKSLQLVFINGCSSDGQTDELLAKGMPAVIGTLNPINDEVATNLSIRFYGGLGLGASIEKSWMDAVAEAKTKGVGNLKERGLSIPGKTSNADSFAWELKIRPEAGYLKSWNLPDTAQNPLFGLPPLAPKSIPGSPFVHRKAYDKDYADVFLGRSKDIRDLYFLVTDKNTQNVILLHGQSGVGKSSLLKAGLIPRLDNSHDVLYVNRDESLGLAHSLFRELLHKCGYADSTNPLDLEQQMKDNVLIASLATIAQDADTVIQPDIAKVIAKIREKSMLLTMDQMQTDIPSTLAEAWILAETKAKRPLLIVLDQVEETFTKPNSDLQDELNELLSALKIVFDNTAITGKIILCCKGEYMNAIDEHCRIARVVPSRFFLKYLDRNDIIDILSGLISNSALQGVYNLTIEPELAELIATDYTRGGVESPVSPFLQILLSKMWEMQQKENPGRPVFSIDLYRRMHEECMVIQEFFQTQLDVLRDTVLVSDAYSSGMALDMLFFHCTSNNTSCKRTEQEIMERYPYAQALAKETIACCKDLLLLVKATDAGSVTVLAHDILALEINRQYQISSKPVQQAYRLLSASAEALKPGTDKEKEAKNYILDDYEVKMMTTAQPYLRILLPFETELLEKSKQDLDKKTKIQKKLAFAKTLGIVVSVMLAMGACVLYARLRIQERKTYMSRQAAASSSSLNNDNTLALFVATLGYDVDTLHAEPDIKEAITAAFYTAIDSSRPFYKCIVKDNNAYLDAAFSAEKEIIIPYPQDSVGHVYDLNGKTVLKLLPEKGKKLTAPFTLLKFVKLTTDEMHIVATGSDSVLRVWDMTGKLLNSRDSLQKVSYFVTSALRNQIVTLYGNTVKIKYPTGAVIRSFTIKEKCVALRISPDGTKLVAKYEYGPAEMYCLEKDRILVKTLNYAGSNATVLHAIFSSSGKFLLTSYADSAFTLWDSSGNALHTFPKMKEEIIGVDFHPSDSMFLIHSGHNGWLYSTKDFKQRHDSLHHPDFVIFAKFSPSGNQAISSAGDKCGIVWSLLDGTKKNLMGHTNDITSAFFSADEKTIFTTSLDGTVKAWDLNMYHIPELHVHSGSVLGMQMHPDSLYICSVGEDSTLVLSYFGKKTTEQVKRSKKMMRAILNPVFSSDGDKILCMTSGNGAFTWDWKVNNLTFFSGHTAQITGAGFVGHESIATIAMDQTLRFWDYTGHCFDTLFIANDTFCTLGLTYNGSRIAAGTRQGVVYVFDSNTKATDTLRGHTHGMAITSCHFSRDGKKLVSASEDNTAIIWDMESKTHVVLNEAIQAHYYKLRINSVRFSQDGLLVATASSDRAARLWDVHGNLLATLSGHTDDVLDAKFTPHNQVVTYSLDGTIRYWQQDGSEVACYKYKKAKINHVIIDKTGECIYSATDDGTIRTWLTPRGVFDWVSESPFYKYFRENKTRYKVRIDEAL